MPKIFRSPKQGEYWISERIYVQEIMNAPQEEEISLARCRLPPGQITQLHSLSVTEWYMIEQGNGLIEIDGQSAEVKPGDCIKIDKSQAQRISNTGAGDLVFLTLCRPRFTPDAYTNLERRDR